MPPLPPGIPWGLAAENQQGIEERGVTTDWPQLLLGRPPHECSLCKD